MRRNRNNAKVNGERCRKKSSSISWRKRRHGKSSKWPMLQQIVCVWTLIQKTNGSLCLYSLNVCNVYGSFLCACDSQVLTPILFTIVRRRQRPSNNSFSRRTFGRLFTFRLLQTLFGTFHFFGEIFSTKTVALGIVDKKKWLFLFYNCMTTGHMKGWVRWRTREGETGGQRTRERYRVARVEYHEVTTMTENNRMNRRTWSPSRRQFIVCCRQYSFLFIYFYFHLCALIKSQHAFCAMGSARHSSIYVGDSTHQT